MSRNFSASLSRCDGRGRCSVPGCIDYTEYRLLQCFAAYFREYTFVLCSSPFGFLHCKPSLKYFALAIFHFSRAAAGTVRELRSSNLLLQSTVPYIRREPRKFGTRGVFVHMFCIFLFGFIDVSPKRVRFELRFELKPKVPSSLLTHYFSRSTYWAPFCVLIYRWISSARIRKEVKK